MDRRVVVLVAWMMAGCGSSNSAPPAPSSAPTISNLAANFSSGTCVRAADGLTGRALVITFDFADPKGDTNGGRVQLTRLYSTGRSETHFFAIPTEVAVAGTTTAGQIRIPNACPLYGDANGSTERLTLIDAGGGTSNTLSASVTRPAGAP